MPRTLVVTLTVTLLGLTQVAVRPARIDSWSAACTPSHFTQATSIGTVEQSIDDTAAPAIDDPARSDELDREDVFADREDVLGNDVSDAVATYKLDTSGALYEEHAPDTEVPRLASPTT